MAALLVAAVSLIRRHIYAATHSPPCGANLWRIQPLVGAATAWRHSLVANEAASAAQPKAGSEAAAADCRHIYATNGGEWRQGGGREGQGGG